LSVFRTWELSLGNLDSDTDTREKIVQFVTVSAYLDIGNIFENLLKLSFSDAGPWMDLFLGQDRQWDGNKFLTVLVKLRELALIQSFSPKERRFSLHPVVSDWLKCRSGEGDLVKTQRSHRFSAAKLVKNYLRDTVKNLPLGYLDLPHDVRQNMLLHATSCLGDIEKFSDLDPDSSEWEEIAECLAEFHDSVGDFRTAEILENEVVRRRKGRLEPANALLLTSQGVLAFIYHHQGRFKEAESVLRELQDREREALESGDPAALRMADIFVHVLAWQEKYEEAEKYVEDLIQIKEKVYGKGNRSLLKSNSMLAWVLENNNELDKAEMLNNKILKERNEYFGESDLDTLTSYNAQGVLYHMTGRLQQGEEFIRKAALGREQKLGRTHPDTLNVLTNLSMILASQQNKIAEAEKLAREVMKSRQRKLGESHISTLVSVANLIRILMKKDPSGQLHRSEIDGLRDGLKATEKSGQVVSSDLESDLKTLKLDADAQIMPARGILGRGLGGRGLNLTRIVEKRKNRSQLQPIPDPLPDQKRLKILQSAMQVQQ
jgi:tetratricopeptide (TPR) repeat protein